jgi:hypothetical protein
MGEIVKILQNSKFSLEQAEHLLPIVKKITKRAVDRFVVLEEKLQHVQDQPKKWQEVEQEIAELLNEWSDKIAKLGCLPKGIWLVDFDNGKGYYCWRYGDDQILYFHGYNDAFAGRVALH